MQKNHHLKETWKENKASKVAGCFTRQESEYQKLFKHSFGNGSYKIGRVLEIGAGTGDFAAYLLDNHLISSYTILDIERSMGALKHRLEGYENVEFIYSFEYEKIFEKEYDLLVSIQCLSETPPYYSDNIFSNIKVSNTFIIDGNPDMLEFDKRLLEFTETYSQMRIIQTDVNEGKLYMGSNESVS